MIEINNAEYLVFEAYKKLHSAVYQIDHQDPDEAEFRRIVQDLAEAANKAFCESMKRRAARRGEICEIIDGLFD